jgi:hypothetical protein
MLDRGYAGSYIRTSENSVKAKFAPSRSGGPTLDVLRGLTV